MEYSSQQWWRILYHNANAEIALLSQYMCQQKWHFILTSWLCNWWETDTMMAFFPGFFSLANDEVFFSHVYAKYSFSYFLSSVINEEILIINNTSTNYRFKSKVDLTKDKNTYIPRIVLWELNPSRNLQPHRALSTRFFFLPSFDHLDYLRQRVARWANASIVKVRDTSKKISKQTNVIELKFFFNFLSF